MNSSPFSKSLLITFFLFFLFSPSNIHAQVDTVKSLGKKSIRIYSNTSEGAILKMDSIYLKLGKQYFLEPGKYTFTLWAPKRQLVKQEVNIGKGSFVRIKLPYTDEYKSYRRKLYFHHVKKHTLRYLILGGLAYYTAKTITNVNFLSDRSETELKAAEKAENNYNSAIWPSDIYAYRIQFLKEKSNYNNTLEEIDKTWKNYSIVAGLAAVSTYFTWKWSNKLKRPEYKESPLLSNTNLSPGLLNDKLVLNLSFKIH